MATKTKRSETMTAAKAVIIDKVLANSVYMPESGAYQLVARALGRMPLAALRNLKVILDIKTVDTQRVDKCEACGYPNKPDGCCSRSQCYNSD